MHRPDLLRYMTISAHAIGNDQILVAAHRLMQAHGIRHLPVLQGGVVVGVVSESDILFLESKDKSSLARMTVDQAMTRDPYVVAPDAPLDEVVAHMVDHHIGSAVVVEEHRLVGMFTVTDALRALAELAQLRP
jgi:acetoin utilization protein AcuB